MILVVCNRDIDSTLVKGDLVSWFEEANNAGKAEGIINGIDFGQYLSIEDYLARSPFAMLALPLVTISDIQPILNDLIIFGDGETVRKWKIDYSDLEYREEYSTYDEVSPSPTRDRYIGIEQGSDVRRDTLNAYLEILRDDIKIDDIQVLR